MDDDYTASDPITKDEVLTVTTPGVLANDSPTPFYEPFDTDAANNAAFGAAYPDYVHTGDGVLSVVNGVFRIENPNVAEEILLFPDAPTDSYVVELDVSTQTTTPGSHNVGLRIGGNNITFHPGYTPIPGAFRVDGPGGFGNTNMGFVPPITTLHHMTVEVDATTGVFDITIVNGSNPAEVFTASFTNPASVGQPISLRVGGATNGQALYDNVSIRKANIVAFDATSTEGAAVTVNPDGSFTYDPAASATIQALNDAGKLGDGYVHLHDQRPVLSDHQLR